MAAGELMQVGSIAAGGESAVAVGLGLAGGGAVVQAGAGLAGVLEKLDHGEDGIDGGGQAVGGQPVPAGVQRLRGGVDGLVTEGGHG
ncbi:hypothetical protein ACFV0B_11290 [Streptomyces xanthophaeus]|uniref:hypothetical protein n=1 Tax=Streptomyces xanthophaeus TaxID=67385 RepID=UPI0036A2D8EA